MSLLDQTPPPQRVKRKYTKRAKTEIPAKREKKTSPKAERNYALFMDEDGGIQLCPTSGEGESINLTSADALAVVAFVARLRD